MRNCTFWLHSNGGAHSAHGVEGATCVVAVGGAPHTGHGERAQEQILPLLAHVGVVVQYSRLCTCKKVQLLENFPDSAHQRYCKSAQEQILPLLAHVGVVVHIPDSAHAKGKG